MPWITQWKWRLRWNLNWWVIGYVRVPGWAHCFCLGPTGIECTRADFHI